MNNFFSLENVLHLCNPSIIHQNKNVIHSFSKYHQVDCLLTEIKYYLYKCTKLLHLTPQITFLCHLNKSDKNFLIKNLVLEVFKFNLYKSKGSGRLNLIHFCIRNIEEVAFFDD